MKLARRCKNFVDNEPCAASVHKLMQPISRSICSIFEHLKETIICVLEEVSVWVIWNK